MAAIDNDDTSGHFVAHHNVFAFSEMGLKVDFAGHDNVHHHNLYAYVQMCGYLSEYHPHALDGHEAQFYSNICAQFEEAYYIMGQTCNYTQPDGQWSFVPGTIASDPDTDLNTYSTTVEQAKRDCGGGNSWCVGFSFDGADPSPAGAVVVRQSKVAGVTPNASRSAWVFPEKAGLTVAYNNTLYTPRGVVKECGLNLSDWQAQSPWHDPGTTVAPFPDDGAFAELMRVVLGLPPANKTG